MTSEKPGNVKKVYLKIFKLWNGFCFINFIQICSQKPVKMALRPNLQQRDRSRRLICEFVAIIPFKRNSTDLYTQPYMLLSPFRKGAGPKKARSDQWELTVTLDPALFMSWTMTELHLLLPLLSPFHPLQWTRRKLQPKIGKRSKKKKGKPFRFHFWEIRSHHCTCWCHGRLISNCIFKKKH